MKEDDIVNKSQLIDQIAADADISKAAAGRALVLVLSQYVTVLHVQAVTRKLVKQSKLLLQLFQLLKPVKRLKTQ